MIEKWDNEHNTFNNSDPIELLKSLMIEHNIKAKDLADILELSKGTISKILNYYKGLSKETIACCNWLRRCFKQIESVIELLEIKIL